jgi:hypothetical protein
MWPLRTLGPIRADFLALEANVERARFALACPFSSSAEFEAAVIQARRDAGLYGPKKYRRRLCAAGAALAAVGLLLVI